MTSPTEQPYVELLQKIGGVEWMDEGDKCRLVFTDQTGLYGRVMWDIEKQSWRVWEHRTPFEAHAIIEKAWREWMRENDPDHLWRIEPVWDSYYWKLGRDGKSDCYRCYAMRHPTEAHAMLAAVDKVLGEKGNKET